MKTSVRFFLTLVVLAVLGHVSDKAIAQIATHVVISEVYGGGGNSGSTWTNDFVELYNPTGSAIDLTGWSVQYSSATGATWATNPTTLSGSIPAHGFYLVQEAAQGGGTQSLPTPDATGIIAMGAGAGKVALVNSTTVLTGTDPHLDPSVVDFVGYGTTPNGFEGSGPTGVTLTNTTSGERKAKYNSTSDSLAFGGADTLRGNGWDVNDNASDFTVRGLIGNPVDLPNPQNSSSPLETPPALGNIPPIIGSITRSFLVANVGGVDTVKASVSDFDGTVAGVKLNITVNGGTVDSSITMTHTTGSQYVAIIPTSKHSAAGNLVEYWVSATDNSAGYSTTGATPQGYFVGDAPITSIKAHAPADVSGYAARVNGTLNVNTNLYSSGQGFIQDGAAGLQIFKSGGLPALNEGRNAKVQGTLVPFSGAFELTDPSFAFVDTSLGTSAVTPVTITLPINETPQYLNEGRLVKIVGVTTAATGTFAAATNYLYQEVDADTITVRVESNGTANNLVGRTIPTTPIDAIGVLSFNNVNNRLKPRKDTDMGIAGGDGSGTAAITPAFRFTGVSAAAETLTIAGNGANTLEGASVAIPSTWTWDGTSRTIAGTGFATAVSAVTGTGTLGDPWVITVTGGAVTNTNTGIIRITNLSTPGLTGLTTWIMQTRITAGTFANIAAQPTVNIVSGFEAVNSGNWSNPATWSNGVVPGPADNATFTTRFKTVTIDVANAQCNNLTMRGDTTLSNSGPVLQFAASGASQLTVNGAVSISGGSGGGGGDRGGRPQLTSNGNALATLIVKGNVATASSNTVSNGNAGLNMNEGTVKLIGATSDSIVIGAGHRLGNLEIGDGATAKTVSTAMNVTSATMAIRSLTVKQGSTFNIGTATTSNVLTIGSLAAGVPTLNGGITVQTAASLRVQLSTAGEVIGTINLFGGGITNNGTIDLLSFAMDPLLTHCHYNVNIDSANQSIGGNNAGTFADVTVGSGWTLTLNQRVNVNSGFKMTVKGNLAETSGHTVVGAVQATRIVPIATLENFGGIGLEINAAGAAPDTTTAVRVTGVASIGGSSSSILRYFDISPRTNTGLNATMRYFYDNTELAGQDATTLQLWKSDNSGSTWTAQGGSVDTSLHRIQLAGVNSFSRWTASDAAHSLTGGGTLTLGVSVAQNWNIVSLPVSAPTPNDSVRNLFVHSINPYAFAFSGGYVQVYRMTNGPGYWIKSSQTYTQNITGTRRDTLTIPVAANWNMIGSISTSIDTSVAHVTPSVPGLRVSNFFKYVSGYVIATTVEPGLGYWLKARNAGSFFMHATGPANKAPEPPVTGGRSIEDLNTLTIQDANGGSQTLYFGADAKGEIPVAMFAMPPAPPAGSFDARFESSEGGLMVQTHAERIENVIDLPITIQSSAYPLTVSWNVKGGTYELSDGAGVTHEVRGEGTLKIMNSSVNRVTLKVTGGSVMPKEFALSQNYPNPFNPTTNIKYALPVDSKLTMEIYNVIGQRVRTLVNGDQAAGYHIAEWNGTNNAGAQLASGMYFLQMSAKGTNGKSFNEVRKLMMLK